MKRLAILATLFAALAATSVAQAAPPSGMLLGVYAFSNARGLRITGTIPGYSAHGVLFNGDTLTRVTADGFTVYPTRTHWQMENAKDQIGPFQPAALEVYRPGVGYIYFWVEFRPVGGVAAKAYTANGQQAAPQKMEARIMTEKQKPGARALFNKRNNTQNNNNGFPGNNGFPNNNRPQPGFPQQGIPVPGFPRPGNTSGTPGSLFGR